MISMSVALSFTYCQMATKLIHHCPSTRKGAKISFRAYDIMMGRWLSNYCYRENRVKPRKFIFTNEMWAEQHKIIIIINLKIHSPHPSLSSGVNFIHFQLLYLFPLNEGCSHISPSSSMGFQPQSAVLHELLQRGSLLWGTVVQEQLCSSVGSKSCQKTYFSVGFCLHGPTFRSLLQHEILSMESEPPLGMQLV